MTLAFKDAYPPEIVEWATSEEFVPDNLTPERGRILAILEDEEMMLATKKFMHTKIAPASGDHPRTVRDCEYIEAFRYFIEDAARLPDKQPPGTHMRAPGEPLMFSTPGELKRDLAQAQSAALEMAALIERTAPSLGEHFHPADATQLIAALDAYYTAALNAANEFALTKLPGTKSGRNAVRNWLMREIGLLANLHLQDRVVPLVVEVARILLAQEDPTEESTAREILMNTRLVPVEALEESWKGSTEH